MTGRILVCVASLVCTLAFVAGAGGGTAATAQTFIVVYKQQAVPAGRCT